MYKARGCISFGSLVLCVFGTSLVQAQIQGAREATVEQQAAPKPPEKCRYYVQGLNCIYMLRQDGKPTSWKFGESDTWWTCHIEVPVRPDSDGVSCEYSVTAPCHKEPPPPEISLVACALDPGCGGRPFTYDYQFRIQLKDLMSRESAEAVCKGVFTKLSTQTGEFSEPERRFTSVIPGSGISCEGPCEGPSLKTRCGEGQPSFPTSPICKVNYPEKPTAKAGHFYFAVSANLKRAECQYVRECHDFTLHQTLSAISRKSGRMCSVFGSETPKPDASSPYQKFCSMTEEDWKKNPKKTHLTLRPSVYDYNDWKPRYDIKPPESGRWSWDTYLEWARKECAAIEAEKTELWEAKAFRECRETVEKLEQSEVRTGGIPSATMACCDYSISE